MNSERAIASVQYDDMKGTAAADWRGDVKGLEDFAQSQAIDLQNHVPVGTSVYLGEPQGGKIDSASVSIFAVDPTQIGRDADEINIYVESHENVLPCKRFRLDVPLPELLKFYKRFNLILFSRYIGEILELEDE